MPARLPSRHICERSAFLGSPTCRRFMTKKWRCSQDTGAFLLEGAWREASRGTRASRTPRAHAGHTSMLGAIMRRPMAPGAGYRCHRRHEQVACYRFSVRHTSPYRHHIALLKQHLLFGRHISRKIKDLMELRSNYRPGLQISIESGLSTDPTFQYTFKSTERQEFQC